MDLFRAGLFDRRRRFSLRVRCLPMPVFVRAHCAHHGPDNIAVTTPHASPKPFIDLQLEITASAQRCGIHVFGTMPWLMVSWQSPRLIIQMEMSSLLTLDAIDRAIGDFLVAFPYNVPRTENRPVCYLE